MSAVIAIVEVPSSPPVLARLWRNNASASTMATPEGTKRGQRHSAVTWPVIILSCCWGGGGVSLWVNSCFLMQSGPHIHNKNFYIVTLLYQLWGLCKRLCVCVCVHACKCERESCMLCDQFSSTGFFLFFPLFWRGLIHASVFNNHHRAFPVGIPPWMQIYPGWELKAPPGLEEVESHLLTWTSLFDRSDSLICLRR